MSGQYEDVYLRNACNLMILADHETCASTWPSVCVRDDSCHNKSSSPARNWPGWKIKKETIETTQ